MKYMFSTLALAVLLLAACTPGTGDSGSGDVPKEAQQNERSDTPPSDEGERKEGMMKEDVMEKEEAPAADAGSTHYAAYSDGVLTNGEESVLFFHATWCSKCKSNDELLSSWYDSDSFGRSVYKVDYDSATELKSRYGITGQDTFILVDGEGNELKRAQFPSKDALKDLLG